jgi:hypothetical protein
MCEVTKVSMPRIAANIAKLSALLVRENRRFALNSWNALVSGNSDNLGARRA